MRIGHVFKVGNLSHTVQPDSHIPNLIDWLNDFLPFLAPRVRIREGRHPGLSKTFHTVFASNIENRSVESVQLLDFDKTTCGYVHLLLVFGHQARLNVVSVLDNIQQLWQ